ncbi:MAG: hypothetical protein VYD19_11700, partial [Myxococcota bacterium]|nr:hypothetical protein [Myxococcota bacterium]
MKTSKRRSALLSSPSARSTLLLLILTAPATLFAEPAQTPRENEDCADCHPAIAEDWWASAMGQSLRPLSRELLRSFPEGAMVSHPEGFRYRVRLLGEKLRFELLGAAGPIPIAFRDAAYLIGGRRAATFLWQKAGRLGELPLTHYRGKGWRLSPGFQSRDPRFGRLIDEECLFCHRGTLDRLSGPEPRFAALPSAGIGCESCHLDATAHQRAQLAGQDHPADQRKAEESCTRCHQKGAARVPWRKVNGGWEVALFEVEGGPHERADLLQSSSYQRRLKSSACGARNLNCADCHPPHRPRAPITCEGCHVESVQHTESKLAPPLEQSGPCLLTAATRGQKSCAHCHMPRRGAADIPHLSVVDHRIERRPDEGSEPAAPLSPRDLELPLRWLSDPPAGKEKRLIEGLAYTRRWRQGGGKTNLGRARKLLQEALQAIRERPTSESEISSQLHAEATLALARLYSDEARWAEAQEVIESLPSERRTGELKMTSAEVALALGQSESAYRQASALLQLDTVAFGPALLSARALSTMGQGERAWRALRRLALTEPG